MRKVRQFVWGDEQQAAFEEIKGRLQKSPVLHLPDKKADSNYIQTPAKLLLVVLYTKFRMANQNLLHMLAKDYLRQQRTIP